MAVGDSKTVFETGSITASTTETFDFQPAVGETWIVYGWMAFGSGLDVGGSVSMRMYNGTDAYTLHAEDGNESLVLAGTFSYIHESSGTTPSRHEYYLQNGRGIVIDNDTYLRIQMVNASAAPATYQYIFNAIQVK
jgi:hypothetical protein|tara:strand:- start:1142 stop:1549 length:408 start_codon:yes stop_codon:yes gene_type:complete